MSYQEVALHKNDLSQDLVDQQDGDDDIGPELPKIKKRKMLQFEEQYLQSLPLSDMYEKSYMHRDTVSHVAAAESTDFVITASLDGIVKFWKKGDTGIEFAKQFKSHLQPITGLSVSVDGSLCATISNDKTAKVFDIATFDMIAMLRLPFVPGCVEWIFCKGDAEHKLAISDAERPAISIFDVRSGSTDPIGTAAVHSTPVLAMKLNSAYNIVVSTDKKGIIEYWSTEDYALSKDERHFASKMDTDLFALLKAKTTCRSLAISPDGEKFACYCDDQKVRVFRFLDGKLSRVFDESIETAHALQREGGGRSIDDDDMLYSLSIGLFIGFYYGMMCAHNNIIISSCKGVVVAHIYL